jgi:hypothetical protein
MSASTGPKVAWVRKRAASLRLAGFSITAAGGYTGSLTEAAGVWTGTFGAQTLTFTNATGSLVIVPEPSAAVLVSILATLGIHRMCRRQRDPAS